MNEEKQPKKEGRMLTGADVARILGVSYHTAVKLPIPRFEVKVNIKTLRRYQERDVLDYIAANTKVADGDVMVC